MNIGLLCIATNKYLRFVKPLLESAEKHFMPGHVVTMFVFTNHSEVPLGSIRIEQEHMPWPNTTLKRYHMFYKNKEALSGQDYLFYCDADMLFVDRVGNEALGDLVATIHPGFYNKPRGQFSYETRKASSAYIAPNEGLHYFAGGFNGGNRKSFLAMSKTISENIDRDSNNGIVAVWHDESHMNRYMIDHPPGVKLSPSYVYPESWSLPFPKKLLALDKNHAEIRS